MALRTLGPKAALALDQELMSSGSFSLDQLMELAGLSISQALYILSPPQKTPKVLIACGPGNNGGDGLVAARHLFHFGYQPRVYYPKPGKHELYARLRKQLDQLRVEIIDGEEEEDDFEGEVEKCDIIIDAVFGFSFQGKDGIREPFGKVIAALAGVKGKGKEVLAVDVPSGWDVEMGPPGSGVARGYMPSALISLTAPKPLIRWFEGRHFVGGRFVGREVAERFGFDVPEYVGGEQVVEVENRREETQKL